MHHRERHRWVVWCGLVVLPALLNVLLLGASVARAARVKTSPPMIQPQLTTEGAGKSTLCQGAQLPAERASLSR